MGRYNLYLLMIMALIKGLGAENTIIRARKTGIEKENIKRSVSKPVELVEKRTWNSKTFLNPDGSYTAIIYPVSIHYYENGEWKEIPGILSNNKDYGFSVIQNIDSLGFYKSFCILRYKQDTYTFYSPISFDYIGTNENFDESYTQETFRTLFDYDVSAIPSNAIVQELYLILRFSSNAHGNIDFTVEVSSRKKKIESYTTWPDTLWLDIDNGKFYGSKYIEMDSLSAGFTKKQITLNSDAVQDFQNRLPFGLFKVGLKSQSEGTDGA